MKYDWKNANDVYYYYQENSGLIVGQVHNVAYTKIWVAKITITPGNEKHLGQYISDQHAKIAVENYWIMQERTLIE